MGYFFLKSVVMVGTFLMIFAEKSIKHRISRVNTDIVKCGIGKLKLGQQKFFY